MPVLIPRAITRRRWMGDKSQKDKNKVRKQKAVKSATEDRKKRDKQEGGRLDPQKTENRPFQ
jgi:hypothetical protein